MTTFVPMLRLNKAGNRYLFSFLVLFVAVGLLFLVGLLTDEKDLVYYFFAGGIYTIGALLANLLYFVRGNTVIANVVPAVLLGVIVVSLPRWQDMVVFIPWLLIHLGCGLYFLIRSTKRSEEPS